MLFKYLIVLVLVLSGCTTIKLDSYKEGWYDCCLETEKALNPYTFKENKEVLIQDCKNFSDNRYYKYLNRK